MTSLKKSSINQLFREAQQAHRAIEGTAEAVLDRAIEAGERLLAAKELVAYGEWGPRLEAIGIPKMTASRYMLLARHRDRVLASGVTSIRQALLLLADRVPQSRGARTTARKRQPKPVGDRYAEGYNAGYRAGRADGSTGRGRVHRLPSDRDLLWLIKQAHPDLHQSDAHDVLVATRLTVWLNELRKQQKVA
jgi:hypothetical protein